MTFDARKSREELIREVPVYDRFHPLRHYCPDWDYCLGNWMCFWDCKAFLRGDDDL